jgi:hypothetical protein
MPVLHRIINRTLFFNPLTSADILELIQPGKGVAAYDAAVA